MAFENDSKMLEWKNPLTMGCRVELFGFVKCIIPTVYSFVKAYFPSGAEIATLLFLTGALLLVTVPQLLPFFLIPSHVYRHVIKVPWYIIHRSTYNGSLCPNFSLWFFCLVLFHISFCFASSL